MKASHRKWVLMGVCAVFLGAGTVFLLRVTSRSEAPAAAPRKAAAVAENPEHELKALAMELEKKPGHTPILMRMAQLEHDKGRLDDAAGHLRMAAQNEPSNQDVHLELGRVLYEKGDVDGAISETEKVLSLNPSQVDALYNLGAIYANRGNPQQARSYWIKAVTAEPAADSAKKARDALARLGGS